MKPILRLLTLSLITVSFAQAAAPENIQNNCGERTGANPFSYCITTSPESSNRDVVYYFHGGPGDEREWIRSGGELRSAWRNNGDSMPTVVAVSFAPLWLLIERNKSPRSGQYQVFLRDVMPYIERDLLKGQVGRRWVIGLSMGGFSATQLLTKNPGKKFAGVALLCPMLVDLAPDVTDREYEEFKRRSRRPLWDPRPLMKMIREVIPDRKTWDASSPFRLAERNLNPLSPKLYMSTGSDDNFIDGIYEFAAIARRRGTSIRFEAVPGGHCEYNARGTANFLMGR